MANKLFAMEELQEKDADVLGDTSVAPENAESELEASQAGTNDELSNIKEHADAITQAEGTMDALSEIRDSVGETDTLTESGAKALNVAVEHLYSALGPYKYTPMFSAGNNHSVALESIGDKLSTVWEAIKAAFRKMMEFFKSVIEWVKKACASIFSKQAKVDAIIADVKKEHTTEEVHTAEAEVQKEMHESGAFTEDSPVATKSDIEILMISNNPTPQKKMEIGVGKNPNHSTPRDNSGKWALKNARLANFFSGTASMKNYSALTEFYKKEATVYDEFSNHVIPSLDRVNVETTKHDYEYELRELAKSYGIVFKAQGASGEKLKGDVSTLNRGDSTEVKVTSGLPFGAELTLHFQPGSGGTVEKSLKHEGAKSDIISIITLADCEKLSAMVKASTNRGLVAMTKLEKALESHNKKLDNLSKDISPTTLGTSGGGKGLPFATKDYAEKAEAQRYSLEVFRGIKQMLEFSIKDVSLLMQYKAQLNSNLIDWMGHSVQELNTIMKSGANVGPAHAAA